MYISWDAETMSTGMRDIDEQHQELIKRLNMLLEAMKLGRGKAEIENLLGFLGEYAVRHFGHEENCMGRFCCPAAAANKKAHAYFIRVFDGLSERISKEGVNVTLVIEAQRELANWVTNHIKRIDGQLKQCVRPMPGASLKATGTGR